MSRNLEILDGTSPINPFFSRKVTIFSSPTTVYAIIIGGLRATKLKERRKAKSNLYINYII